MLFKSKYSQAINTVMDLAPDFDPALIPIDYWMSVLDNLESLSPRRPKLYVNSGMERQLVKTAALFGVDSQEALMLCRKLRVEVDAFKEFVEWRHYYVQALIAAFKHLEEKYPDSTELKSLNYLLAHADPRKL